MLGVSGNNFSRTNFVHFSSLYHCNLSLSTTGLGSLSFSSLHAWCNSRRAYGWGDSSQGAQHCVWTSFKPLIITWLYLQCQFLLLVLLVCQALFLPWRTSIRFGATTIISGAMSFRIVGGTRTLIVFFVSARRSHNCLYTWYYYNFAIWWVSFSLKHLHFFLCIWLYCYSYVVTVDATTPELCFQLLDLLITTFCSSLTYLSIWSCSWSWSLIF